MIPRTIRWGMAAVLASTSVAVGASAGIGTAGPPSFPAIDVSSLSDGQAIPGRYVVIMADEPLVAEFGQEGLDSPAADAARRGLKRGHERAKLAAGISASQVSAEYTVALNGFAAELTDVQLAKLESNKNVAAVLPDTWRTAQTDNSGDFLGLTAPGGLFFFFFLMQGICQNTHRQGKHLQSV